MVPPPVLVLLAVGAYQLGAAFAKEMFAAVGPAGAVFLRFALGAAVLLVLRRPRLHGHGREAYGLALMFGLSIAGTTLALFAALDRIPLGPAVAIQFVGPLAVAVAGSRRPLDVAWVALAGVGIALFVPWGGGGLDPVGIALALVAGGGWASYILLASRAGRVFPGNLGLVLAMVIAALALAPTGFASGGAALAFPSVLATGFVVALLSTIVPLSLEYEALKRLPPRVYGVLVSLEPAVGALVGLVVLGESLEARTLVAVVLVTVAATGAALTNRER